MQKGCANRHVHLIQSTLDWLRMMRCRRASNALSTAVMIRVGPARWSPALLANLLKGHPSKYLRERFPRLKRLCGPDQLWSQAYCIGTVGQVSAETIRRYIQECQGK
jgi:hypothetical protein